MDEFIKPNSANFLLKTKHEIRNKEEGKKDTLPFIPEDILYGGSIRDKFYRFNLNDLNSIPTNLNMVTQLEKDKDETNIDVVIIFALTAERTKAFEALNVSEEEQNTTYYDLQRTYGFVFQKFEKHGLQIAVVTQTSMGMTMASSLVTRAILAFRPKLVAMTGICAGRQLKVKLGDLLVADQVYDYTAGKLFEGERLVRPRAISCDDNIKQILFSPALSEKNINMQIRAKWEGSIPVSSTAIHIKAMGSGSSVVDDKTVFEDAIKNQDDLFGIDMEAYGVALAADVLHTPWLIVKGIQDYGDGQKNTTENSFREYAAFISAVFLGRFLEDFSVE